MWDGNFLERVDSDIKSLVREKEKNMMFKNGTADIDILVIIIIIIIISRRYAI